MPYDPAQHRLFEWVSHQPQAAQAAGYKIPQAKAATMASEGVKTKSNPQRLASILQNMQK